MTLFLYDAATGALTKNGSPAGTKNRAGYLVVRFQGKVVYVHRLAWYLHTGNWPETLDHVNGIRDDNRIENLREVDATGNAQNMTSGKPYPGAHFHKPSGRWKSAIKSGSRTLHLGYFPTAQAASEFYLLAKSMIHPTWRGNHA